MPEDVAQAKTGSTRSTAELVAAVRALTGKPGRTADSDLTAWLVEQEIENEEDFLSLTEQGVKDIISRAPGISLLMADALRRFHRQAQGTQQTAPSQARRLSLSIDSGRDAVQPSVGHLVEIEVQGHVGTIMMNNAAKRNALSTQLCLAIQSGLERCCSAGVRVVVLRAQPGVKVWSAGHDMREFLRSNGSSAQSGEGSFAEPLGKHDPFVCLLDRIRNLPVPVIGCIEGSVWGGACDLCACCDVLLGTPDVTFAITPAKVGLPYNASGMAHFVGVLPLHVVRWMFFSSSVLSAEEAHRYGFLNSVVPHDELSVKASEMAAIIASRAPLVVTVLKKQLTQLCATANLTPEIFEELHEMRKAAWSSGDMEEGVNAFFDRRQPVFKGL